MTGSGTTVGVTDIHGRLLDHKPVIQSEIKYFLKEFETKRSNRDFDKLEQSLAGITDIKSEQLPEVMQLMERQLPEILVQISAATTTCQRLIDSEEQHLQANPLEEHRKLRAKRWAEFREKLTQERDQVDIEHRKRITAIEEHFELHTQKLALE
ncbi:biogenesis of lysosome-related organelles complex 1 subunit 5-like isoform X2 [Apostichopus japonicus]|uniref:biogenesis of lysosome-related organelles complex 1 subunit 5-like isoform X2 n=1 Tax=Stichopus japonicus TaxID=307972 RepID=UPI003AB62E1B